MSERGTLALFDAPRRAGRPRSVKISRQLEAALHAAEHLRHEDLALIEVGRRLAAELDANDDIKTVTLLTGQLLAVIDRLGMSPKGRAALGVEPPTVEEVNPLDALSLIRGTRRASGDDTGT